MSKKHAVFVAALLLTVIFVPLDYVVAVMLFIALVLPVAVYLLRVIFTLFK